MSPTQRRDLHRLMVRLADGDRSVLDQVQAQLWPVLRQFTGRLLGHDADAEDVAQEALVKIFARMADFDPSRDGLIWALTISSFEVKTARKRRQRRREVSDEALAAHRTAPGSPLGWASLHHRSVTYAGVDQGR